MLRGCNPCIPAVDIGADLVLDSGIKIQVKSASLRKDETYPFGAYWFKLGRTERVKNTQIFRTTKQFSNECDFVVLFGIDEGRFWIVPSNLMDNHQLVVVGPSIGYKDLNVEQIKELTTQGLTQEEIAEQFTVSPRTISRRLSGEFVESKRTI